MDSYTAFVEVDGKCVELGVLDTSGSEDFDRLRQFSYPNRHVLMVAFGIDSPDSADNIEEKVPTQLLARQYPDVGTTNTEQWIHEIRHYCPKMPFIVVGLRKDLRNDPRTIEKLALMRMRPVSWDEVSPLRWTSIPSPADQLTPTGECPSHQNRFIRILRGIGVEERRHT